MQIMSRVALLVSVIVIAGCAKSDKAATDSAAAAAAAATAAATPAPAPAPAAPAPISLADVAGKWQVRSVPTSGTDTIPTNFVLTATADTTGWLITFPTGVKVPMQVSASGDSLIVKSGTFASQRRKGVKVATEGVWRLENGSLAGMTTARYVGGGADSVLVLRMTSTKMP